MKDKTHTDSSQPRSVYERMIAVFFNFRPVEELHEIIHDTFLGYGTAAHEFFRNREEVAEMARIQAEQLREQTFDLSRKPITEKLLANGSVCLIVEEMDLFMHAMEHRLALRLSTLLEFKDGKWQVSHFHGSTPDSDIAEEEAFPMEGLRRKNEELEAKIRERTRELEIEASLERVRTRAMAMHTSEELNQLIGTVFKELTQLELALTRCIIMIFDEATASSMWWMANSETPEAPMNFWVQNHEHKPYLAYKKAWKERDRQFAYTLEGKEKVTWDNFIFGKTGLNTLPEAVIEGMKAPERVYLSASFNAFGCLSVASLEPLSDSHFELLLRFARVFDLTYRRFNDLQKAEAQAREAEIELALERVRAQAMAMRHSDDLVQSTAIVFEELEKLNLSIERSGIGIFNAESRDCELWTTVVGKDGEKELATGVTSLTVHPMLVLTFEAWEAQQPLSYVLEGKELADYYKRVAKSDFVLSEEVIGKSASLEREFYHYTPFGAGGLYFFAESEPSAEDKKIIRRFAEVFDLTYTRFLDLQKAEAQAREAQIEAALERIRSQVTGMQESAELLDIVVTMRTEFGKLGHEAHYFWYMRWLPESYEKAMTSGDGTRIGMVMKLPRHIHGEIPLVAEWEQSDRPTVVYTMDADAAIAYVDKMVELGDFQQIDPQAPSHDDIRQIGGLTFVMARTTHGEIGYSLPGEVPAPPAEDLETLVRFAGVFDLAYRRFEDLKKSEQQKREAEIELALERVRSRSMAMQTSEELQEVIRVIFEQLTLLHINAEHAGIVVDYSPGQDWNFWVADKQDIPSRIAVPYLDLPWDRQFAEAKEKGIDFFATHLNFEEKNSFYQKLLQHIPGVTQEARDFYFSCPGLAASTVLQEDVALYIENFSGTPYSDEENKILRRFGKVFQQTYTRFLDLQKAETQAREAQIETALERVRARTMAMQSSDELAEASHLLDQQVRGLGIETWGCAFHIYGENEAMEWFSSEAGLMDAYPVPRENIFKRYYEVGQQGVKFYKESFEGETCRKHYEYLCTLPVLGDLLKDIIESGESFPEKQYDHVAYFKYGHLLFITLNPVGPEDEKVFVRFAEVFEQTYTRFLDLQKAEAQAREAKIEAALEKVRSRTMAMQHSEELPEAANVLFLEIQALGIPAWSCGYNVLAADKKTAQCWMSSEGTIQKPFTLRLQGEASFDAWEDFIQGDLTFLVQELGGQALESHYTFMKSFPDLKPIFDDIEAAGLSLPTYQINHLCKFTHGFLLFITYEAVADSHDIFKRFSAVFEQTYTRFLDLKKVEAQAREARIETALERVRARALAMQQPEELKDVAQVLRHEMGLLGVEELETSSIYINDMEAEKAECWYAIKDIREQQKVMVADHFTLDLHDTWVGREMLQFFDSDANQISIIMKGKQRREWIDYCEAQSEPLRGYYGKEVPDRTYHLYKFSHGAIGVATAGELSGESWGLLRRAASVFSLAYSRFRDLTQARLDLQKLKEEKKRAEEALAELQLTQKQLVHAEKMASLGELTAGIAHEIQNPLNFVNNFSEVSRELLEEMIEELKKGDAEEADAIARDVILNLEKIVHHGKRADGIVKGMLQHSRTGDGHKQPTDLSKLADEYLRLAYHGLRAKDKSFNASMETGFDPKLPQVSVVPQDIGRVLLNLVTNAFHAVSERKASAPEGYEPTVWVSTRKTTDGVEISVRDNGGGIPDSIKDKIFQPFFTTKPTGQGTGLGLSMSYDIVTKGHGGQLRVASKPGDGSEFIVILPV